MAENKTQHTPLEWSQVYFPLLKERHIRYYGDGTAETLAVMNSGDSNTDKANAKYIVNCVNSHDRLVEALKMFITPEANENLQYIKDTVFKTMPEIKLAFESALKQVEED